MVYIAYDIIEGMTEYKSSVLLLQGLWFAQ